MDLSERNIKYCFWRSAFMLKLLLIAFCLCTAFYSEIAAQAVVMLRSNLPIIRCTITQPVDAILMKEVSIAEVKLDESYTLIVLPQSGSYFITVDATSAGIHIENYDTLWLDWLGKKEQWNITKGKSRELNLSMWAVDSLCDARLFDFLKYASVRRAKEVKYFTDTLRKNYEKHPSDILRNYVFYRTAYVEVASESDSRARLMKKYFEHEADPDNFAWIESFRNLYNGFILQKLNSRNGVKLQNALREKSWKAVWTEFRNDTLAMHPEIREFAFLLGINQVRNQSTFRDVSLEWMLDSLIAQSIYPHVKKAATSLKTDWLRYKKGNDVPDFSFRLLSGKDMHLNDLNGRPVYLCYYAHFNQATLRELAMLQAFKERFKNEIEFLVVVNTSEKAGLIRALESIKSTLLVSDVASCSESFNNIPETANSNSYFLINRKGQYYRAPAEGPETGIEDAFLGLVKD